MKHLAQSGAHRCVAIVVAALVLLGTTGIARADRAVVFVTSPVKERERAAVNDATTQAVTEAGWTSVAPTLTDKARTDLAACLESAKRNECALELLTREETERAILLRVAIEGDKLSPTWVVYGWVFAAGGKLLALDTRYCESCSAAALPISIREIVAALVRQATAETQATVLVVRSTPTAARVTVDDRPVGVTELEFDVYPGTHLVRLEREGYRVETRTVDLKLGERQVVDVELLPTAGKPLEGGTRKGTHAKPSRLPLYLLGTGGALVVGSGVLFLLDEDTASQGADRLPEHRETTVPAVITGGVGVAALGVGAYLLLTRKDESKPQPVMSFNAGSASIGVAGAF